MNALLAAIELLLAALTLHRAVPSVLQNGRMKALNIWALGVAMGLFGVDRFAAYLSASGLTTTLIMAHSMLITYGSLRYLHIARRGLSFWGNTR